MVRSGDDQTGDSSVSGGSNRRAVLKALGGASAVGLTGLSGCLTGGGGGGGGGGGTVKYGVLSPMTGPYSALAKQQRQGAKLAVKWVNEIKSDKFDFTIEATYKDTKATPNTGTSVAREAIQQDNANYLMGAISSSVALSLNTVAKDQEVLYNPGGAAIPITGKKCNKYVFRVETNTAQNAEASAGWTLKNLGKNVWFHIANYAYGKSVLREWRKRVKDVSGFNEVGVTRAPLGETNFDSYISEMMNSDADVVVVGATGGDLVNFIKQADSAGLKKQMDIMTTAGTFASIRKGIGTAGYGVYGGTRYVSKIKTGDNQKFVSEFKKAYGRTPDNFARVAFDSIRMTAHGIQQTDGTAPADVIKKLPGLDVPSLFGTNNFRKCNHQATNPVWIGKNVKPDSGKTPAVELITKQPGKKIIPPCSETGCKL